MDIQMQVKKDTKVILLTMGLILLMGVYNPILKLVLPGVDKEGITLIRKFLQAVTVIGFISMLKWWPRMGLFTKVSKRSLYILMPVVLISFIPLANGLKPMNLGAVFIAIFTAVLIGIIEELEYRGLILEGLRDRGPFATILLSSVIFGLFHFLNLIVGAALEDTIVQVLFALFFGLIFAVIRYRSEGMWLLILVHGLWDFNFSIANTNFSPMIDNIHSLGLIIVVLWGALLAFITLRKEANRKAGI